MAITRVKVLPNINSLLTQSFRNACEVEVQANRLRPKINKNIKALNKWVKAVRGTPKLGSADLVTKLGKAATEAFLDMHDILETLRVLQQQLMYKYQESPSASDATSRVTSLMARTSAQAELYYQDFHDAAIRSMPRHYIHRVNQLLDEISDKFDSNPRVLHYVDIQDVPAYYTYILISPQGFYLTLKHESSNRCCINILRTYNVPTKAYPGIQVPDSDLVEKAAALITEELQ